ncbi:MAG: class I SAM-dependent methyltransferase [Clostridiales bacterium]|nr:class I SAM-dependent methyltransferase [Clostridiales bacterium]
MDKTNLKENMKRHYDTEASLRDSKSVKPEWKIKVREKFYDIVRQEGKKTLLELGAGAGYDRLFFMENGLSVTAVDLSKEMVAKCRGKGD